MSERTILVCDQTLREGMQFRGLVFSRDERVRILAFQERLGVDISQAAYPPAHESEVDILSHLQNLAEARGYWLRISGLCRALMGDVQTLQRTGVRDFHMHMTLRADMAEGTPADFNFDDIRRIIDYLRGNVKDPHIAMSVLDLGRTPDDFLKNCVDILGKDCGIDVLTFPDTSGMMMPHAVEDKFADIMAHTEGIPVVIGAHCHNDLGMATANTVMAVRAGVSLVEVTALGIGERNGIGDLFLTGKCLKESGYDLNLRVDDIETFRSYYEYVNRLCVEKTGYGPLNYQTPYFGEAMGVHVAGTHGKTDFGIVPPASYVLNVLCGRHLVKRYLDAHRIPYAPAGLADIVKGIKDESAVLGRGLRLEEVERVVSNKH